jgi:glycosyltransferase involved in cell wall biosynthesis
MADVCLVPSLYDDLSLTVLESVAHATPIVATANTGFPDVEKVGIQVPPKDPESIAEAVITLLSDDELYAKKRQSAEPVIKEYYWPNIGERFMTIYNELMD